MRRVALLLLVVFWTSGCAGRSTPGAGGPASFQSGDELMAALQAAGAQTSGTAKVAVPVFGVAGQVWQVGQAEVQTFSFPSTEERARVSTTIAADGRSLNGRAVAWADRPNIWASGRLIVLYLGTDGGTILLLSGILGDALTQPAGEQGEPYPPAVAASIASVAREEGVTPGAIEVISFDPAQWPDTCLGLPAAGEACAQHVTPGWRIQLRVNGQTVVVRSDDVGAVVRRQPGP